MRRGATIVETIIAVTLGLIAIIGVVALLLSVTKSTRAGDLANALQEAALALASIERDVMCAASTPDGRVAVRVSAAELKLALGTFQTDGRVGATLVRYQPEAQQPAGFRIRRTEGSRSWTLPGLLERFRFEELGGAGGPYLRVTLHVAAPSAQPAVAARGATSEPAVLSGLIRLTGTELAGSRFYSMSFLDDVAAVLGP